MNDPEFMEEIIASGKADVVLAARAFMADPDFPKKARASKADEIRPCIRCFECFAGITRYRQYRCAVNPEIGFEQDSRHALPATTRKTVLIVGGGVAGMQAALTAAERGHKVVLCEKNDRLGGVLRCEEQVPFKRLLARYLDYQERMIKRAPIDVRLGTEVTPGLADMSGAEVIIAALGAREAVPPIPGIDGANVLGAEEAYMLPGKTGAAGSKVIILGGGLVGIELAIFLSSLGRKVTIIEMMENAERRWQPGARAGADQRDQEVRHPSLNLDSSHRDQRQGRRRRVRGRPVHAAGVRDGAEGGAAVEQLQPGRQARRRGGQQAALSGRDGNLCDGQGAAAGRGRRAALLRAGVPPDRRLLHAAARCSRRRGWPLPSRGTYSCVASCVHRGG